MLPVGRVQSELVENALNERILLGDNPGKFLNQSFGFGVSEVKARRLDMFARAVIIEAIPKRSTMGDGAEARFWFRISRRIHFEYTPSSTRLVRPTSSEEVGGQRAAGGIGPELSSFI